MTVNKYTLYIKKLLLIFVAVACITACASKKEITKEPEQNEDLQQLLADTLQDTAPPPPGQTSQPVEPTHEEYEDDSYDYDETHYIRFQYASDNLTPASKRELSKVIRVLKENRSANVTVAGYTCNVSSELTNMRLSRKRAESVASYLKQAGINSNRITVEAFGQANPMVPNSSDANRAKNRRVEITIEK
ncbi:MAG: OmpA family protein [Prevotellaceae bacterium]|jgi:outer membrane protein OmpA-like peptidoglycan-associated protein|nr:OmpA family protein [Prevotellaceae bacterium]